MQTSLQAPIEKSLKSAEASKTTKRAETVIIIDSEPSINLYIEVKINYEGSYPFWWAWHTNFRGNTPKTKAYDRDRRPPNSLAYYENLFRAWSE